MPNNEDRTGNIISTGTITAQSTVSALNGLIGGNVFIGTVTYTDTAQTNSVSTTLPFTLSSTNFSPSLPSNITTFRNVISFITGVWSFTQQGGGQTGHVVGLNFTNGSPFVVYGPQPLNATLNSAEFTYINPTGNSGPTVINVGVMFIAFT